MYLCSMLYLKLRFYCLTCSVNDFRDFNSCVSKKDEYRNYWVLMNAFWIRLRFARFVKF